MAYDYDLHQKPKSSQEERDKLNNQIIVTTDNISDLKKKKYSLQSEQNKLESEVGPIKYIAELIYGESSSSILDDAVRMVILTLVFVFDPLAVLLIIAANISINEYNEKRKIVKEKKSEGDITTTVQKKGEFREVVKEQNGVEIKYYE